MKMVSHHCKTYKKRPIYWMFSSPKRHFNGLVYIHRHTPQTMETMLEGYINPLIQRLSQNNQSVSKEILLDLYEYQQTITLIKDKGIVLDLDDGVRHNASLFGNAIRGF